MNLKETTYDCEISIILNIYIYQWSYIFGLTNLTMCTLIVGLKFKGQLTNWPLENQAVELECRQITCSPAEWEVKVKRPSAAYVYKINQILVITSFHGPENHVTIQLGFYEPIRLFWNHN